MFACGCLKGATAFNCFYCLIIIYDMHYYYFTILLANKFVFFRISQCLLTCRRRDARYFSNKLRYLFRVREECVIVQLQLLIKYLNFMAGAWAKPLKNISNWGQLQAIHRSPTHCTMNIDSLHASHSAYIDVLARAPSSRHHAIAKPSYAFERLFPKQILPSFSWIVNNSKITAP